MAAAEDIRELLARLGPSAIKLAMEERVARARPLGWPELEAVLPDAGMPRGVVELSAPHALGGATSVALALVGSVHAASARAWCAWIDPEATLHAPGVAAAGVALERMLVVRAPRGELARVAVKVVASGAFDVVVIDVDAVPGAARATPGKSNERAGRAPRGGAAADERVVRKLALAAEPSGATVLLLTDSSRPRAAPWPVALRLELSRPGPTELAVRVGKDKRARIGLAKTIPFRPAARLAALASS
jgi:hypothetical protein